MSPILVLAILTFSFRINIAQETPADPPVDPPADPVTNAPAPDPGTSGTAAPPAPGPPRDLADSEKFIVPETIEDGVDSFKFGDKEYLLVYARMRQRHANLLCQKYKAQLAVVKTDAVGNFLAEALSETNLLLDTLWVSATLEQDGKWWWRANTNESEPVDDAIVNNMVSSNQFNQSIVRDCLGFGRSDHDKPEYRPINCAATRSLICERSYAADAGAGNSTHMSWITVGIRQYKIFREPVDYNTARLKCGQHEVGADLAVIANMLTVETLSRYLLIGRPSLENAWIQAKYVDDQFVYPSEKDVLIPNTTDSATGFPPWRNGAIQKPSGCLLLDRHLADKTLFVEARCQRMRPYICYRRTKSGNDTDQVRTTDAIINAHGYRLVYNPMPWEDASEFCKVTYTKYGAKLAEPATLDLVMDITFFFFLYKTAVDHVWIGGKMESVNWIWDSNSNPIDDTILTTYGITNTSYSEVAEVFNVCLNFDRENHNVPVIYGTVCAYPQSFICMFDKDQFVILKEDEKKAEENNQVI